MRETETEAPLPQIAEAPLPQIAEAPKPSPSVPMCCASVPEVNAAGDTVTVKPCGTGVAPGRLMCDAHWALVPNHVRRLLIEEQNLAKLRGLRKPSEGWRELAKMAITSVWRASVKALETEMQAVIAARQAAGGSVAANASPEAPAEAEPAAGTPPDPAHG